MMADGSSACFLSLDLSPKRLRALVIDERLDVFQGEVVTFDVDLPEYATSQGVHVRGDGCTAPVHMHVKALDLVLEKLSKSFALSRIKLICGSAHQHTTIWWSYAASDLLARLQPAKKLADQLQPEQVWTLSEPPSGADAGAVREAGGLEWGAAGGTGGLAGKTGIQASARMAGPQIMRLYQSRRHLYEATDRISLGSSFLASLLLGRIAPLSEAEASCVGLWSVADRRWDPQLLSFATDPGAPDGGTAEGAKLSRKLGQPVLDGAAVMGTIASYYVRRYGFDPACQLTPFLGHHHATFLSHRLAPRDALVVLGRAEADAVYAPTKAWIPDGMSRWMCRHPAKAEADPMDDDNAYMAVMDYKDAGIARSYVRDVYCSAQWHVFDTLVGLIAEGGKIGLDDKCFSFFRAHGEMGVWQGISRFEMGLRAEEFHDRRVNPRALLEAQFSTMRIHLARLLETTRQVTDPNAPALSPYNVLGFDPYDKGVLPSRLIVAGGACENRTLADLLSCIMGCPLYTSTSLAPATYAPHFRGDEKAIAPPSVGAACKAAWTWMRSRGSAMTYDEFLLERLKQRARRHRSSTFEGRRPSIPLITTSIASFEAPEASSEAASPTYNSQRRMSFSTLKLSPATPITGPGSPTTAQGSVLIVPIHTHPDDAAAGLVQITEPDDDLFERYGAHVEEYARLDHFVSRGIL